MLLAGTALVYQLGVSYISFVDNYEAIYIYTLEYTTLVEFFIYIVESQLWNRDKNSNEKQ